jgi:hypothetical protein
VDQGSVRRRGDSIRDVNGTFLLGPGVLHNDTYASKCPEVTSDGLSMLARCGCDSSPPPGCAPVEEGAAVQHPARHIGKIASDGVR